MMQELERINRYLEGADRNTRAIETPEGVTLDVEVANAGERLAAFAIDLFFWGAATAVLVLVGVAFGIHGETRLVLTAALFSAFLLRNLYFLHFEMQAQGATPGKRIVGLRVIDRKGGPLTADAIVARNLTREVEFFLPLSLLASLAGQNAGWLPLSYLVWIIALSALPAANRDRLRAGDLIAGTMVISLPRRRLLGELAQSEQRYTFSSRELGAYGAFELQVLEEVLRRPPGRETTLLQQQVCRKIAAKIGYSGAVAETDAFAFLSAFYTAERAHLERERLFGRFRADKESAATDS